MAYLGNIKNFFSQLTLSASDSPLFGMPMVIIYKVSLLSYLLGRALIRGVNHIGLVNLIAGEEIVPELLQNDASADNIADMVFKMLNDTSGLERLRYELLAVRDELGGPGASQKVAEIAGNMMAP